MCDIIIVLSDMIVLIYNIHWTIYFLNIIIKCFILVVFKLLKLECYI